MSLIWLLKLIIYNFTLAAYVSRCSRSTVASHVLEAKDHLLVIKANVEFYHPDSDTPFERRRSCIPMDGGIGEEAFESTLLA